MMKQTLILLTMGLFFLAACGKAPEVIQGVVTGYDPASKTVMLQDEQEPHRDLTFSLQQAEIGAEPAVGDSVRLSYRTQGETLLALRVMNLSQRSELQKKGSH
jgi:hypothetical protein